MFETEVKKVAPEFKDRLYFINNLASLWAASRAVWNNPGRRPAVDTIRRNAILDTKGESAGT